ncbi:MAG TPA: tetratricopeptide repeat protein [Gemmatimonadaceae bacterium]|nr:tetratricopeptide repeat protein [Gemmatimonadaceae bacterium]
MASPARIDELRKKFDENPRRYFAPLANEYRKLGDLDQAIFICQEYLPQQPGHMSGHIVYGQALYEAKQLDEARAVFETALTLDPENLIALRHLGDIANGVGDSGAARAWYQRVLEADPRNEEIATLLNSLLSAPAAESPEGAGPAGSPAQERYSQGGIAAVGEEAPPAEPEAAGPAPPPAHEPESRYAPDPVAEQPPVAQPAAAAADELFDISELDIGGETIGSARPKAAAEIPKPEPSPETDELVAAEFAAVFEPDHLAVTGFQDDAIHPGVASRDDSDAAAFPDGSAQVRPTPSDLAVETVAETVVETIAETAAVGGSSAPSPPELESNAGVEPYAEPSPQQEPIAAEADGPVPAAPFVTETMAELYMRQGHRSQAVAIYRELLEQRPDDEALRARLVALETPRTSSVAQSRPREVPGALAAEGPSIREALRHMFWEWSAPAAPETGASDTVDQETADDAPAPDADDVIDYAEPREIETSNGGIGSIDALFPAEHAEADLAMAMLFADAYRVEDGESPLRGVPAHRATSELSLEQVFRGEGQPRKDTPVAGQPAGLAFDQFFAGGSSGAVADAAAEPVAGADAALAEDVEAFNAWLQGLKKP